MTHRPTLEPPKPTLFRSLVRLAAPRDGDPLIGDLEEEYRLVASEAGPAQALWHLWSQTLRSLPPLLWERGRVAVGTCRPVATGLVALVV